MDKVAFLVSNSYNIGMKKRQTRLFFLLPVLYIGVLFLLVAVQFSKNESFNQSFGDLAISGKSPGKQAKADDILDLKIRGRGLEFFFSGSSPILIETADAAARPARLLGYEVRDKALVVSFQQGLKLYFEYRDEKRKQLTLRAVLEGGTDEVKRLSIPWRPDGSANLQPVPGLPLLDIVRGGTHFAAFTAGGPDRLDSKNGLFSLQVQKNQTRPVRVDEMARDSRPAAYWAASTLGENDNLSEAVKTWLAKAWNGWSSGRFHSGDVIWDAGEGSARFSQNLVLAYLTEARIRGSYGAAFDQIQPGITAYPDNWGFPATTYLGDLMNAYQSERRSLEILAARQPIDFSAKPNLVAESFYHGPTGFFDQIQKTLSGSEPGTALNDRLAFVENLANLKDLNPAFNSDGRYQSLLQTLLPAITRIGGGLFVQNDKGFLDLKAGIRLARLLQRAPDQAANPDFKVLANALAITALGLADQYGQMPEVLFPEGDSLPQREGILLPEQVYAWLTDPAQLPREISLAKDWGGTSFLLTAAKVVDKTITPQEVRLTFEFPTGYSHGFILQGVQPFDHIRLHDTRWRTDPEFQQYSDGWYYSASLRTLYVKIKHRQERETFVLKFVPEEE